MTRWAQGGANNIARAVELFQRAYSIREHHLQQFLVRGSEQDKWDYLATIEEDPDVLTSFHLSVGPTNIAATRLALTTVLQRKGRLLDAVSEGIITLRRNMKPEDEVLLDQLADVSKQRANLFMQAQHAKIAPEQYFSQKTKLEKEARDLEAKISAHSSEFKVQSQPITFERVQQAIPKDTVLVEYLRYRPLNSKAQKYADKYAPARYITYVLKSSGEPQSVELGDATAIDQLVNDWRKALIDTRNPSMTAFSARQLDEKIMQPVRNLLGTIQTILLSPDGTLNLVPFAALQDENNRYLIERYAFTYLSSGRDLLKLNTHIASQQPATIFADIDYGPSD